MINPPNTDLGFFTTIKTSLTSTTSPVGYYMSNDLNAFKNSTTGIANEKEWSSLTTAEFNENTTLKLNTSLNSFTTIESTKSETTSFSNHFNLPCCNQTILNKQLMQQFQLYQKQLLEQFQSYQKQLQLQFELIQSTKNEE